MIYIYIYIYQWLEKSFFFYYFKDMLEDDLKLFIDDTRMKNIFV